MGSAGFDGSRRAFLTGRVSQASIRISKACLAARGVVCRSCEDACDARAISFQPRLGGVALPRVELERCTRCADCMPACPAGAITVDRPLEASLDT